MTARAPNLYAHLGVSSTADRATIRRAFRARAKLDHPDAGGSVAAFALTKLAHDILIDNARRARYDATGDTSEAAVDNTQAHINEIIAALLQQTIGNAAQRNVDILAFDFAEEMRSLGRNAIGEFRKNIAQINTSLAKHKRLIGRFKRKQKKNEAAKPNIVEAIVLGTIAGDEQARAQLEKKIEMFEKAIELLRDYTFDVDVKTAVRTESRNFFAQVFVS